MRRWPPERIAAAGVPVPRSLLWGAAGLSLAAGVLGYSLGRDVAGPSETEVIAAYGALYAQQTGGAPSDCAAVPGLGAVWLIVSCGTDDDRVVFHVGYDGQPVADLGGVDA